jgi:hypothetical protein
MPPATPTSTFQPAFASGGLAGERPEVADDRYRGVKVCIWIYFWLLIFEGALRKWVFPGLANPLLVVRDPVVIVAYLIALRKGLFPRNGFVTSILVLGFVTFGTAVAAYTAGLTRSNFIVTLYGARTNFLHFPFIFLMAAALGPEDLKKMGKWLLIISVPMALLVAAQFRAAPEAWVNKGTGVGEGGQMLAGIGIGDMQKVRAAGFFSYNTGLATFLSLAAAFLINHFLRGKVYARSLALAASFTVAGSALLSASRTTTLSVVMVAAAGAVCVWFQPKFFKGSIWLAFAALIVVLVFASSRTISEGIWVLGQRFEAAEGLKVGILDRALGSFTEAFGILGEHGIFGVGLGVGTNVGAGLLTRSRDTFLAGESEWPRVIGEVGPVLGLAFILFRVVLTWHLFRKALAALRRGEPLAMLLFGMCGILVLNGGLGTAAMLGFTVFGAGLTLVAAQEPTETADAPDRVIEVEAKVIKQRGRSAYAERLHSSNRTT